MSNATDRRFRRASVLCVWFLGVIPGFLSSRVVGLAESPAESAARKLAWELESRRAVEVRVRTDIENPGAGRESSSVKPDFTAVVLHYIETAAGQRYGDLQALLNGKPTMHSLDYGDGSRFAHVDYDRSNLEAQRAVFITRQYPQEDRSDKKNLPPPLLYEYVGREPLPKALARAEPVGAGSVIHRPCDAFLFRRVPWLVVQDQVFYLDRETGTPLKVVSFRDEEMRKQDEPLWVWEAESFEVVSGHPVVQRSTLIEYDRQRAPNFIWREHVEFIEFDKDYSSFQFWPTIQRTATVFDSFTKQIREGAKEQGPSAAPAVPLAPRPSLEATQPYTWVSYMHAAALGLGSLAIITAVILWRRQ